LQAILLIKSGFNRIIRKANLSNPLQIQEKDFDWQIQQMKRSKKSKIAST
jgi:hypothetical protein